MPSITVPTAILASAALGTGAAIYSASTQSSAAKDAAKVQAKAANRASDLQMQQFQTTQQNLAPYMDAGKGALGQLVNLTGAGPGGNPLTAPLTAPFQPTMAQLEGTPGFQFALKQGLQATQNGFAAQGLGSSGAAVKGAGAYAEGLASTTYQQQFENYMAQQNSVYSKLGGIAGSGQAAAGSLGQFGQAAATNEGNFLTSGAAATAGGIVGSANAWANGVTGVANSIGNASQLYAFGSNNGLFASGTSAGDIQGDPEVAFQKILNQYGSGSGPSA